MWITRGARDATSFSSSSSLLMTLYVRGSKRELKTGWALAARELSRRWDSAPAPSARGRVLERGLHARRGRLLAAEAAACGLGAARGCAVLLSGSCTWSSRSGVCRRTGPRRRRRRAPARCACLSRPTWACRRRCMWFGSTWCARGLDAGGGARANVRVPYPTRRVMTRVCVIASRGGERDERSGPVRIQSPNTVSGLPPIFLAQES